MYYNKHKFYGMKGKYMENLEEKLKVMFTEEQIQKRIK